DEERAVARAAELQDRAWKTEERWRYDADVGVVVGGVVGLGDSEDGEEVRLIVDDYDSDRQWPLRKKLLLEEDFNHLMRIDDRHTHAAVGLYDALSSSAAQVNGTAGNPINLPHGNPIAIAVPASQVNGIAGSPLTFPMVTRSP
ncbi:hypothetical protein FRC02_005055, partial [Tulasnella sp. 418]